MGGTIRGSTKIPLSCNGCKDPIAISRSSIMIEQEVQNKPESELTEEEMRLNAIRLAFGGHRRDSRSFVAS